MLVEMKEQFDCQQNIQHRRCVMLVEMKEQFDYQQNIQHRRCVMLVETKLLNKELRRSGI